MRRASVLWEAFVTRFEAVLARQTRGSLSADEAGEALGMSGRQFRRLRVRYAADGVAGLADRRVGRVSGGRAPVGGRRWASSSGCTVCIGRNTPTSR